MDPHALGPIRFELQIKMDESQIEKHTCVSATKSSTTVGISGVIVGIVTALKGTITAVDGVEEIVERRTCPAILLEIRNDIREHNLTLYRVTSLIKRHILLPSDQRHPVLQVQVRLPVVTKVLVYSLYITYE